MNQDSSLVHLRTTPIVAIRGSVVFPHTDTILSFARPKSVAAVNAAFQEDRVVAVFTQKEQNNPDPTTSDLYSIGTIATITQMMSTEGELHAMVRGQARIRLVETLSEEPYLIAKVEELHDFDAVGDEVIALSNKLTELFKRAINLGKSAEVTLVMKILSGQVSPQELSDQVAFTLQSIKTKERQKLLEMLSVKDRLIKVTEHLSHEANVLDLERTISVKTQKRFEDQMRKAMLRERKKAIEQELGEGDEMATEDDVADYEKRIKKAKMPKEVHEKALKELKRLKQMSPNNPETGYIRNYLDWLCDMPWSTVSSEDISISGAQEVLDTDHYGIEKVKQRILEYLAVMQLQKDTKEKSADYHPTILCFIGPPGVGKTSIGKSIAKSLGRKFVRISLGGVRDEAEIRGHRRTYVGALPGRIIQGIKNAGTKNPVFMLDEIDKLGNDFRGDPSSALCDRCR
jgi:ATP-dependent Lon protease